jgi:hypothetical protein
MEFCAGMLVFRSEDRYQQPKNPFHVPKNALMQEKNGLMGPKNGFCMTKCQF